MRGCADALATLKLPSAIVCSRHGLLKPSRRGHSNLSSVHVRKRRSCSFSAQEPSFSGVKARRRFGFSGARSRSGRDLPGEGEAVRHCSLPGGTLSSSAQVKPCSSTSGAQSLRRKGCHRDWVKISSDFLAKRPRCAESYRRRLLPVRWMTPALSDPKITPQSSAKLLRALAFYGRAFVTVRTV